MIPNWVGMVGVERDGAAEILEGRAALRQDGGISQYKT